MTLPGRTSSSTAYRYGFNGMEKDDELKGIGNSYTTEFRQYDPRVGRWLSLDPLMAKFPSSSPYLAFNNNPIFFIDPTGLQGEEPLTTERRESVLVERIYNRATKTKLNIITHIEVVEEHYIRIYESTNKQVVENVIEKEFKMTTIIVDDYGDELNGNSRMSTTYKTVSGTRKTSKRVKATGFISLFTDTVLKEVEKTVIDKKSAPTLGQGKGVDITFRMGQVKEAIGNIDEEFDGKLHLFGYLDKINSNTKNMDEIVLSQAFTRILNFYKVPAASTIVNKGLSLMLPEHTDYLQTGTYTLHNLRRTYPQSPYPHARTTDDLSSALNKGGVLYPFTNEGKKEVKE